MTTASTSSAQLWIWIDGQPVPAAEAKVPVLDRGFLYGDSVYEVLRTVHHKPLFYDLHVARMLRSASGLGFALPPQAQLDGAVHDTIAAAARAVPEARDFYLRIIVTRGAGALDLDPAAADEPRLVVLAKPLRLPDAKLYREGVALATVSQRRNAPGHVLPEIKSGNYLTSVQALAAARKRGAYEALMLDLHGQISEGASSNFFMVRDGVLCTPPRAVGLLAGITRGTVMKLASGAGIKVCETQLTLRDVQSSDEAFITSSIRGLLPVTRLDEQVIGSGRPGPLTKRLLALYQSLIGDSSHGKEG